MWFPTTELEGGNRGQNRGGDQYEPVRGHKEDDAKKRGNSGPFRMVFSGSFRCPARKV